MQDRGLEAARLLLEVPGELEVQQTHNLPDLLPLGGAGHVTLARVDDGQHTPESLPDTDHILMMMTSCDIYLDTSGRWTWMTSLLPHEEPLQVQQL